MQYPLNKIASLAAVTILAVASVSQALGMEFCLDRNSRLYKFAGDFSDTIERGHDPHSHGLLQAVQAAAAGVILKAAAKDHFHIPACATLLDRVRNLSPETREAIRRMGTQQPGN